MLRIVREEAWVEPPSASRLRAKLYENIELDRRLTRGRGAFVVGPPGAGTSTFLQEVARSYRPPSGRRIAVAAMPDGGDLSDLLVALRRVIGRETHGRERADEIELRLYDEIGRSNVTAIAMDGLEQLVHGTPRGRRDMLHWLRHVGRTGDFRLILSTPPALLREMDVSYNGPIPAEDQPDFIREARPFQEYHLAPFRSDSEYLDVLDMWERRLPLLRAPHLAGRALALNLYALCDGRHGRLARTLRRATAEAIASGWERITVQLLDDVELWTAPSFSRFHF